MKRAQLKEHEDEGEGQKNRDFNSTSIIVITSVGVSQFTAHPWVQKMRQSLFVSFSSASNFGAPWACTRAGTASRRLLRRPPPKPRGCWAPSCGGWERGASRSTAGRGTSRAAPSCDDPSSRRTCTLCSIGVQYFQTCRMNLNVLSTRRGYPAVVPFFMCFMLKKDHFLVF